MPKFIVKRKAEILKEYVIRPFQDRITIGSEKGNDLIIEDRQVSIKHLLIQKKGMNYFLTDLDSAFGTIVNGKKVKRSIPIVSGDEIRIGQHTLVFENVLFEKDFLTATPDSPSIPEIKPATRKAESKRVSTKKTPSSGEATVLEALHKDETENGNQAQPSDSQVSAKEVTESVEKKTVRPCYLLAIYGPYLGKKYQLNSDETKIGRDEKLNDIVIRENDKGEIDSSISRRHATIFFKDNIPYIIDKRSKTRTFVNRQKLDEDDIVRLDPGDEIEIVSDQKSTIFRLVNEGDWNFSPPKRAGDWWIRYSSLITRALSGLVILAAVIIMVSAWKSRRLIVQTPEPFSISESLWYETSGQNPVTPFPEKVDALSIFAPAIADLNGDEVLDMVYITQEGHINVIDGARRNLLWKSPPTVRVQYPWAFVLTDLNNNHLADVVVATSDSRVRALNGSDGTEIWSSPLLGGILTGSPLVTDIDGDQRKDVVVCNQEGDIHIGYAGLSEPNWIKLESGTELNSTPSAGDLNGDGVPEVLMGTENGEVLIIDGTKGRIERRINVNEELKKAKGSFFEDHQIRAPIALGDINFDQRLDLVIATLQHNLLALDGTSFKRLWYDEWLLFGEPDVVYYFAPVLGDVNGDHKLDVVAVGYEGNVRAYMGTEKSLGRKKMLWEFSPEARETLSPCPVLADMNKDGNVDVIVTSHNNIYVLNGLTGKPLWESASTDERKFSAAPLVADMGGDCFLDILLPGSADQFYLLTTNSRILKSTVLWSQLFSDSEHTGRVPQNMPKASGYTLLLWFCGIVCVGIVGGNFYGVYQRRKLGWGVE